MLENGIVRYVLIAGAFLFGTCQFIAMPSGKALHESTHHAAPGKLQGSNSVSMAPQQADSKTH